MEDKIKKKKTDWLGREVKEDKNTIEDLSKKKTGGEEIPAKKEKQIVFGLTYEQRLEQLLKLPQDKLKPALKAKIEIAKKVLHKKKD